ncbi:TBCA-domain-containing protein [Violaceomyces palustris]|uniref:TBCA-domain-containing protein n=1 Tax=Violaceomyces palustris TaxID=1673888 RepID=A0ACD0P4V5_9BASI|nr:TBCA-domain-containing protein [Violaceomyces palustris]
MSEITASKRQLTIKTGVVKRLTKEEKTYVKEVEEQLARIDQYISEGKDEWHVNKQREVLQDCIKMVPDCRKRLQNAVEDLESLLEGLEGEIHSTDEAKAASEVLQLAKASLEEHGKASF